MVHGPTTNLQELDALRTDARMAHHHRLLAARARLLELGGDHAAAAHGYREAAQRATSLPEPRLRAGPAQVVAGADGRGGHDAQRQRHGEGAGVGCGPDDGEEALRRGKGQPRSDE